MLAVSISCALHKGHSAKRWMLLNSWVLGAVRQALR